MVKYSVFINMMQKPRLRLLNTLNLMITEKVFKKKKQVVPISMFEYAQNGFRLNTSEKKKFEDRSDKVLAKLKNRKNCPLLSNHPPLSHNDAHGNVQ